MTALKSSLYTKYRKYISDAALKKQTFYVQFWYEDAK